MSMARKILLLICLFPAAVVAATPAKVIRHENSLQGRYIVVLEEHTPPAAVDGVATSIANAYNVDLIETWAESLQGFLVVGPAANINAMADDPRIKYVEQDVVIGAPHVDTSSLAGSVSTGWGDEYAWNVDRIDEVTASTLDHSYNMCTGGSTGYAYVLDFGIYGGHQEFNDLTPRVVLSVDFVRNANGTVLTSNDGCPRGINVGPTAHGTMVASVLGGASLGSARPQLVSLQVFACDQVSWTSDLLEAMEWIAADRNATRLSSPRVINFSGYVPVWDSLFQSFGDSVVRTVTNTGIPFFASADNFATDACQFSPKHRAYTRLDMSNPSAAGRVFVVGGTTLASLNGGLYRNEPDLRWQKYGANGVASIGNGAGSNGGRCVSIYAPADQIRLATNATSSLYKYAKNSGTSFAAPLVAGVALRYMEKQQATTGTIPSWRQVYDFLLNQSQTPVQQMLTAPSHWVCGPPPGAAVQAFYVKPTECPAGYSGPYLMPQVDNSSSARMLYWDEANGGMCY